MPVLFINIFSTWPGLSKQKKKWFTEVDLSLQQNVDLPQELPQVKLLNRERSVPLSRFGAFFLLFTPHGECQKFKLQRNPRTHYIANAIVIFLSWCSAPILLGYLNRHLPVYYYIMRRMLAWQLLYVSHERLRNMFTMNPHLLWQLWPHDLTHQYSQYAFKGRLNQHILNWMPGFEVLIFWTRACWFCACAF